MTQVFFNRQEPELLRSDLAAARGNPDVHAQSLGFEGQRVAEAE